MSYRLMCLTCLIARLCISVLVVWGWGVGLMNAEEPEVFSRVSRGSTNDSLWVHCCYLWPCCTLSSFVVYLKRPHAPSRIKDIIWYHLFSRFTAVSSWRYNENSEQCKRKVQIFKQSKLQLWMQSIISISIVVSLRHMALVHTLGLGVVFLSVILRHSWGQ